MRYTLNSLLQIRNIIQCSEIINLASHHVDYIKNLAKQVTERDLHYIYRPSTDEQGST